MNRRPSISSSASAASASAKRPAATESASKMPAALAGQAKKRVALANISNQSKVARNPARPLGAKGANKINTTSSASTKKGSSSCYRDTRSGGSSAVTSAAIKPDTNKSSNKSSLSINNGPKITVPACLAPCSTLKSPGHSRDSVSLDETMSTCDSMRSPDFEYIDKGDCSVITSLERQANKNLHISEHAAEAGSKLSIDVPMMMEVDDIIDVDTNHDDPQFCTTLAGDIYRHLRIAETKKRPSTDFMEKIQKDINASMRSILIDWLVEVAEEYRLVPDTLYLTVNYIDRYLSGNEINRQRLQLLGVSCMLIAAKYEEICAPQVEEFCYITDNTYFKDEVFQMEADVLKYLKYEMTAPTVKCFLRRFIRAAQGSDEVPALQLEFLASYVAEISLMEYSLLCYAPSLIAASAIFLARFILQPAKRPWNATLDHYTLYKPSDLSDCVKALHRLFCTSSGNNLPAIREKYSQHKYKFVAKKYCPASIPAERGTRIWENRVAAIAATVIVAKVCNDDKSLLLVLKPNQGGVKNLIVLGARESHAVRERKERDGEKSSGDMEEGPHHSHLNQSDEDSLSFSDAEEHSWHSPYGYNFAGSTYNDCSVSGASDREIDGFPEPCRKSCLSDSSLDDDPETGASEVKIDIDKIERDCRICHLSLEKAAPESGAPIVLGCSCKDDLAAAHKQCAETWFKIKGNKICEICCSTASNVVGVSENEPSEQRNEANTSAAPPPAPPSEARSFWQGHRFLKFLLACLVLAFVVSWLFHFNVPG
ncbi:unnamed protein product [Musa acuminata subsp. burmannicoides]